MPGQIEYLDVRYIIFIPKSDALAWDESDFTLLRKFECLFSDDHVFAEIQPMDSLTNTLTAEDVLEMTDALAVHEEYTNGILTTPKNLETISDIYSWQGSGNCFMADMLTEVEKLSLIMKNLYIKHKERIEIEDIEFRLEKEGNKLSMTDNIDKLFSNDIYSICYKTYEESLWWPFLMEETGFFLVVLDPEMDEKEEQIGLFPLVPLDNPWGSIYDDEENEPDSYIDEYCRRRGLL